MPFLTYKTQPCCPIGLCLEASTWGQNTQCIGSWGEDETTRHVSTCDLGQAFQWDLQRQTAGLVSPRQATYNGPIGLLSTNVYTGFCSCLSKENSKPSSESHSAVSSVNGAIEQQVRSLVNRSWIPKGKAIMGCLISNKKGCPAAPLPELWWRIRSGGCRNGLAFKSMRCSCRGPEFIAQHQHHATHNYL